jgi:PAS domain S-box-containing protein
MSSREPGPHSSPEDRAARRDENPVRLGRASRAERLFHSLVQNSSDIVAILEDDGTLRYVSPAVERVLGHRPEDLVGKSAFDYVHPENFEFVSSSFSKVLKKSGVRPPMELLVRAGDGSWRHVEVL